MLASRSAASVPLKKRGNTVGLKILKSAPHIKFILVGNTPLELLYHIHDGPINTISTMPCVYIYRSSFNSAPNHASKTYVDLQWTLGIVCIFHTYSGSLFVVLWLLCSSLSNTRSATSSTSSGLLVKSGFSAQIQYIAVVLCKAKWHTLQIIYIHVEHSAYIHAYLILEPSIKGSSRVLNLLHFPRDW